MVEDLFRGFVRESWVEDLDFTTLERVNESFTSDGLEQRHADMVWRLRSKSKGKGWFYVFFLLEFQSTPNPFMAVRLLSYVSLLYSGLMRANAVTPQEGLPAVISMVLYNGKGPWRAATDLASLYRSVPSGCIPYLPQLTYILIDENRLSPEELALAENRVAAGNPDDARCRRSGAPAIQDGAPGHRDGAPAMQRAAPARPRGATARGNGERRARTVRRPSGTGSRGAATLRRPAMKLRRRSNMSARRAVPENSPSPLPSGITYA